ncbi:MAG TPA: HyaD/HybD family hydrogenase maturation endopeptidase [Gammaproteobacteria bacterium]|nr:HyaD/HybD family hydrogenase maturation endopeptidase [Gammaproteobacteria bacterium]
MSTPPSVLVLGIGNSLLSDEGVGVHAIRSLEKDAPLHGVQYLDGGTLSFTLAGTIEDSEQLIVVDAAELGAPAGTVRCFEGAAMDGFLGSNRKRSVHEVSLLDLLAVVLLAGRLPERRALVGIQPECIDWGHDPSPAVRQAIPAACAQVRDLIQRWRT